ncbi:MAG: DMT family transporter [Bacteroidia bacterium]
MDKKTITNAYVKLHIAIFLFGFTAILGKLITLEQIGLVWNRLWISFVGLLILPGVIMGLKNLSKKEILRFTGIGVLVALHWVTFYGSIKLGDSASVTLACLATSPLFTSFIEPLITKRRVLKTEVFLGLLTILGVYFVTGVGSFFYPAIFAAIVSALMASTFSTLNKKYIAQHNTLSISVIEFFSGWSFLCLLLPFYFYWDSNFSIMPQTIDLTRSWHFTWLGIHSDWYYLIVLGLLCTCLAFVLNLNALKHVSAFTANLSINLEPVYGIILAAIIFKENTELNLEFYLGTGIILSCVILHPLLQKYETRKISEFR